MKWKTPKLMKNFRTLLIALVTVSAASNLIGCASGQVPEPPPTNLYVHSVASGVALCSDENAQTCPSVPMDKTNGWYMLRPQDLEAQQNYIDLLTCKLRGGCADIYADTGNELARSGGIFVRAEDIEFVMKRIKRQTNSLKRRLK